MKRMTVLSAVLSLFLLGLLTESANAQCCGTTYDAPIVSSYVAPVMTSYAQPIATYAPAETWIAPPTYTPTWTTHAPVVTYPAYSNRVYRTSIVRPRIYTRFARNCY